MAILIIHPTLRKQAAIDFARLIAAVDMAARAAVAGQARRSKPLIEAALLDFHLGELLFVKLNAASPFLPQSRPFRFIESSPGVVE